MPLDEFGFYTGGNTNALGYQSLNVIDEYGIYNYTYAQELTEEVLQVDLPYKLITRQLTDAVIVSDTKSNKPLFTLVDSLGLSDIWDWAYNKILHEVITLRDSIKRRASFILYEVQTLTDSKLRKAYYGLLDYIGVSDIVNRLTKYQLFKELISVRDTVSKRALPVLREIVKLFDFRQLGAIFKFLRSLVSGRATLLIREGTHHTRIYIEIQKEEDDGVISYNLYGATSVVLKLIDTTTGEEKYSFECDIEDYTNGIVSFEPVGISKGFYERKIVITYEDGSVLIAPNTRQEYVIVW